jgi:aldehyde dehydrogenase (NAD+)
MTWRGERDSLFIDGRWVAASGDPFEILSPTTEEPIARGRSASEDDMDAAVAAARRAFDDGSWSGLGLAERLGHVRELRRLLDEARDDVADLITDEMGCPISQSRALQATSPVHIIDAYVQAAEHYPFVEAREAATGRALVGREPVGVVAAVTPWNQPMGICAQKVVPALITGCTVVLKPAPQTALSGYLFAEMVEKAGFPPGVVNVVTADREASETLVKNASVNKVTFTGSTAAGRRIASLCGNDLRRVSLELGGKSAGIVLSDADLDHTVEALRLGAFRNNGQVCTLKTRILVPAELESELLQRLEALVASMPVGDPRDSATQIGPMVSAEQRSRVESYVEAGRREGAELVVGGGRPRGLDRGWFVEPTVYGGVTPDMRIAREEIFGPVLAVMPYQDVTHAIDLANDTPYGLSGAVYTSDLERGLDVARRLRTGVVELNGSPVGLGAPFGGWGESGIGRENGPEGLDSYTELRSIGLPPGFTPAILT